MKIVFDLDGTLCTQEQDYSDARPIVGRVERVRKLHEAGHQIVIFTARGTETGVDWRARTEEQLKEWGIPYGELLFGKPAADLYVDDKGMSVEAWEAACEPI